MNNKFTKLAGAINGAGRSIGSAVSRLPFGRLATRHLTLGFVSLAAAGSVFAQQQPPVQQLQGQVSYTQARALFQSNGGAALSLMDQIFAGLMISCFLAAVFFAAVAIISFIRDSQWEKIQNKVAGLAMFLCLGVIIATFTNALAALGFVS